MREIIYVVILVSFSTVFAKNDAQPNRKPTAEDVRCDTVAKNGQTIHAQLQGALWELDDCRGAGYAAALSDCLITSEDAYFLSLDKRAQQKTLDIIFKLRQHKDTMCSSSGGLKGFINSGLDVIRESLSKVKK